MQIIEIRTGRKISRVFLGCRLEETGKLFSEIGRERRVLVVADENVADLYGKTVADSLEESGIRFRLHRVPSGEGTKSFETVYDVIRACSEFRLERTDTVVGLGGGVVTDLSGFVASIYLRGIRSVYLPTTLLAQVDASVGGKTGVNLPWGKNLAGTFHQPELVCMDFSTLTTLGEGEIAQGMAEIIKCGVIRDEKLFSRLEDRDAAAVRESLPFLIESSVRIKADVVTGDEKEKGEREILNFGHTLGHGIETASSGRYTHGQAVALGMAGETFFAVKTGRCDEEVLRRLKNVLQKYGLPVYPQDVTGESIMKAIVYDKKVREGNLRFVLPSGVGKAERGIVIEHGDALRFWKEWTEHGQEN